MNILYSSDDNYAKISMVSLASMLENNKEMKKIKIYYIDDNISIENKKKIIEIVNLFKREIEFISSDILDTSFIMKTNFSKAGYYRLLISNIILEDKILYIDCDTLILNSLEKLWNINMKNIPIAGVVDTVQNYVATSVGMKNNSSYINSGVMLINLDYWRKNDIEKEIMNFFNQYSGKVPHHDQGVINGVFENKYILEAKYNFMSQFYIYRASELAKIYNIKNYYSQDEIDDGKSNPVIVHFLNKFYGRPWGLECAHPCLTIYNEYLKKYGIDLEKKNLKKSKKVKIRELLYKKCPFVIYLMYERFMDLKRYYVFKKEYLKNTK